MDLNINLNISFDPKGNMHIDVDKLFDRLKEFFSSMVQHVDVPHEKEIVTEKEPVANENVSTDVDTQQSSNVHGHICRLVKALSEKNKEDLLAAAELLDERYDGKNISYLSFSSKVIKTAKVPICAMTTLKKVIGDRFDFSHYHKNQHQNTTELSHDAAILLYTGVPIGVTRILTEQTLNGVNLSYVQNIAKKGFSDEEVFNVNVKYQNELSVYGITELKPKQDWFKVDKSNRPPMHARRFKYAPDKVNELVVMYNKAIRKGLSGKKALLDAAKNAEIKACVETLRSMLFHHKDVPGYERIEQPVQVRERTDITSAETLSKIRTVKFLFHKRGMSYAKIAEETGMTVSSVRKVCAGITYPQVIVDAESEQIFEARYPKTKNN